MIEILTCLLLLLLLIIVKTYLPIFPGDLLITQLIQSTVPNIMGWADFLSKFAVFPWYFILMSISLISTWALTTNIRATLLSLISFGGILGIDQLLRLFIYVPRPSSDLIHVSNFLSGSSLPSSSALIYSATFGYLIMLIIAKKCKSTLFVKLDIIFRIVVLIAVFIARIILGAHWPSDLVISYIIGFLWMRCLIKFM